MSFVKKLFAGKGKALQLRYVKSMDEWEVTNERGIIYVGSKEDCQQFISNMQLA